MQNYTIKDIATGRRGEVTSHSYESAALIWAENNFHLLDYPSEIKCDVFDERGLRKQVVIFVEQEPVFSVRR